MALRTLDDLDLAGHAVLVRIDINVPMEGGRVGDDTRIRRSAPTVREILERGGKPVLLAHLGRPKGKPDPAFSLRPLVPALSAAIGAPVRFAEDCIGGPAKRAVSEQKPGEVVLLENTRFHAGEEANDPMFVASLAALGEVYVNDAFSAAHRAHASTEGLAHLLPSAAGQLMEEELHALDRALGNPERPVMAIVGGAKVSTKLALLGNLVRRVETLAIGGGMANTFLAAQGHAVGRSLCEHEMTDTAAGIMATAAGAGCTIVLPIDIVVAPELAPGAQATILAADACPADAMILDAGPATVTRIEAALAASRTLVWNGPLGAFEVPPFDAATLAVARKAAALTAEGGLVSIAGGGDTVAALNAANAAEAFTYVSTAGGAFLEWLEGRTLPGVAALTD